jgi:triacylglycerol lipase
MLPLVPLALVALEWIVCFFLGMQIFGDTASRRIGELTLCVMLWIGWVRLASVGFSFAMASCLNSLSSRQRLLPRLCTIAFETWATFIAFSFLIPFKWLFAPRLKKPPQPGATIILLVHGLISNSGIWWLFARRMRGLNKALIDSVDLGPPFQSIDLAGEVLDRKLRALEDFKPSRIVLIGHSMGGLVARASLQKRRCALVEQIFTLGTPHRGSLSALVLPLTNLIQMRPSSAWLKHLHGIEAGITGPSVPVTSIYSRHDNLVIPFESGLMEGSVAVESSGVGHLSLLFNANICRDIAQRIG